MTAATRITIGARKGGSIASGIIRAVQGPGSAWSHTAELLPDLTTTVEALALPGAWPSDTRWSDRWRGRVVLRTLADLDKRSGDWIALAWAADPMRVHAADAWLMGNALHCVPYDWLGAAGVPLRMRAWDDETRQYCSEQSAAYAVRAGGLRVSPYIAGVAPTQCIDLLWAAGARVLNRQALLSGSVVYAD